MPPRVEVFPELIEKYPGQHSEDNRASKGYPPIAAAN